MRPEALKNLNISFSLKFEKFSIELTLDISIILTLHNSQSEGGAILLGQMQDKNAVRQHLYKRSKEDPRVKDC